ncbi:PilZ domain-containing protein [Sphingomonas sp.]|uniref:PilZ domain-containing protein n=1 Tax=Sphingomonas sp. TaxID=28214 RepID=UPI0025EB7473|nr:PilZ domain-containing protein [Sphingomonas sp.]
MVDSKSVRHLRTATRHKLFQPTEMSTGDAAKRVHILDLSTGGAMIYASDPPLPGTLVRLQCGHRHLCARVAWNKERRFGLSFTVPLADCDVLDVVTAQDALIAAAAARLKARRQ